MRAGPQGRGHVRAGEVKGLLGEKVCRIWSLDPAGDQGAVAGKSPLLLELAPEDRSTEGATSGLPWAGCALSAPQEPPTPDRNREANTSPTLPVTCQETVSQPGRGLCQLCAADALPATTAPQEPSF